MPCQKSQSTGIAVYIRKIDPGVDIEAWVQIDANVKVETGIEIHIGNIEPKVD